MSQDPSICAFESEVVGLLSGSPHAILSFGVGDIWNDIGFGFWPGASPLRWQSGIANGRKQAEFPRGPPFSSRRPIEVARTWSASVPNTMEPSMGTTSAPDFWIRTALTLRVLSPATYGTNTLVSEFQ